MVPMKGRFAMWQLTEQRVGLTRSRPQKALSGPIPAYSLPGQS